MTGYASYRPYALAYKHCLELLDLESLHVNDSLLCQLDAMLSEWASTEKGLERTIADFGFHRLVIDSCRAKLSHT